MGGWLGQVSLGLSSYNISLRLVGERSYLDLGLGLGQVWTWVRIVGRQFCSLAI